MYAHEAAPPFKITTDSSTRTYTYYHLVCKHDGRTSAAVRSTSLAVRGSIATVTNNPASSPNLEPQDHRTITEQVACACSVISGRRKHLERQNMKYEMIIDDMTWSYSRIGAFDQCPYKFLLKYIHKEKESDRFFSEFGSFMHELIASYLNGEGTADEARSVYMKEFRKNVLSKAPSDKIFNTYFKDGLGYFEHIAEDFEDVDIVDVEKRFRFDFGGHKMVAIIDAIGRTKDGDLFIMDHKSHKLKPRGKKRRKSDDELDAYLRQLYLYSIPVEDKYGERPKFLIFNCFRNEKNRQIVEEFDDEVFKNVKKWAVDSIAQIRQEDAWEPDAEFWKCRHICGMDDCEFKDGGD